MEVKIGIQNVAREVVFESSEDAEAIATAVSEALASGGQLSLTDDKGRRVIVPAAVLGYVEMGPEEQRRVGFGAL